MSVRRPHPHFDDKGTLSWHVSWKEAFAEARRDKKPLFVELGRAQCSSCRTLVQSIVPKAEIAALLSERFVALASDADDPDPEVIDLAERLEEAMMLPFVLLVDDQGRFLEGSSGAVDPARFLASLRRAAGVALEERP